MKIKPFVVDKLILFLTLGMLCFSLLIVYSTSAMMSEEKYGNSLLFVEKQALACVIGLFCMVVLSYVELDRLRKLSLYCLPIAVLLAASVFLPGLGFSSGGARRWLNLGFLKVQPVEFSKLLFVVFLAGYLGRHEGELSKFGIGILKPFVFLGVLAALILKQPDFGSTVIIVTVSLSVIFAAGSRIRHLSLIGLLVGLMGAGLVWFSPYRARRVVSFLNPWDDVKGAGYQLIQSLIAVGSGQVNGMGLGSSQQKLMFLPAAHTDFIFAVVAEELGFVGAVLLISCFLVLLWRGIVLAGRYADDTFAFALALGLTMLIVVPAFLNVGVVIGLLPTKGLVLPLIGYGGSSLIASLSAVGILLALSRGYQKRHI